MPCHRCGVGGAANAGSVNDQTSAQGPSAPWGSGIRPTSSHIDLGPSIPSPPPLLKCSHLWGTAFQCRTRKPRTDTARRLLLYLRCRPRRCQPGTGPRSGSGRCCTPGTGWRWAACHSLPEGQRMQSPGYFHGVQLPGRATHPCQGSPSPGWPPCRLTQNRACPPSLPNSRFREVARHSARLMDPWPCHQWEKWRETETARGLEQGGQTPGEHQ